VGGDAEGGAAAFRVEYFNDTDAFLATSPQFYKQIMVGRSNAHLQSQKYSELKKVQRQGI